MDAKGNAVAVTYSMNGFFGAQVIADHTGFFLNDEMDDFSVGRDTLNKFNLVQSVANEIAPGKRPLSSMTPTIIINNNHVYMILGSPGGPRIITNCIANNIKCHGLQNEYQTSDRYAAFSFPYIPDYIEMEPYAFSTLTMMQLKKMGYQTGKQINGLQWKQF